MKASREYVRRVREAIAPYDTPERREIASRHGMTDSVYRWTQFWAAHDRTARHAREAGGDPTAASPLRIPNELTDKHMDTVLRHVIPPLED